ncbi:hypothetical protein C5167_035945 [Papaver somniferum]|uniref:uncharacterized protein LOC113331589 n=1 Tax=Papaver somniferum TaxID=3469 RepID=UPI000E6F8B62|nr:uncharacterized protein LOC113331589 [Papaver somniferum]RZC87405.1 hypothetical protein C5167_035945 [Papaver somniferum]
MPYAADAMRFYNKEAGEKYELVEPGCLTPVLRKADLLHHVDFTAKKVDVADAPEVMFFAELTTTSGVRSVKLCKCMGPRDSISGDKNNGCCDCTLYNVQHPKGGGFSRGGHGLFRDDSGSSSSSNSKSLRLTDVSDLSLDGSKCLYSTDVSDWPDPDYLVAEPRKERKDTSKHVHDVARTYAADAMNFYNKRSGEKYELVDPGSSTSVSLKTCMLHHVGFTAKKTDVADAPEEMFFTELTTISGVRDVKFLRCMGRKDSISGDKNNGCCYCTLGNIQHPRYGGFSRGGQGLFLDY